MMNRRLPPRTSAIFSSMPASSLIVGFSRSPQDRFLVASECSLARLRRIESGEEEHVDVSAENEEDIEAEEDQRVGEGGKGVEQDRAVTDGGHREH
jgi:hypothetical protein